MVTIYTQAYNVENYIAQCIESVLGQSYGEFEWILVENGSQDRTREIIQIYEKKDARIKCIYHDVNQTGFAQDYICQYAQGEYIAKLDSDDFWGSRYLEKLVEAMETQKADLACCKAAVLDEANDKRHCHGFRQYKGLVTAENIAGLYSEIEVDMNTYWAKLMKKDLFLKADYAYRELHREKNGAGYAGDTIFMYCYLNECHKSVFLTDVLYFYRLHRKNASKTAIDVTMAEDCRRSFDVKREFLQKCGAWNQKNAVLVYQAFWRNIDELFRKIVKSEGMDNQQKVNAVLGILSGRNALELRREYCDFYIRQILSAQIAWCYVHAGKESEDVFRKALVTLEPDLFSEMTKEQCRFLMSEKALLSLMILGEWEEAQRRLEGIGLEGGMVRELYACFYDRLMLDRA